MIFKNEKYKELLDNLNGKKIILVGAGDIAKQFVRAIDATIKLEARKGLFESKFGKLIKDYNTIDVGELVEFAVDNDCRKHNRVFDVENRRFMIFSVEKLGEIEDVEKKYKIVLSSRYYVELFIQLSQLKNLENVECYIAPIMMEDKPMDFWDELFCKKIYRDNIINYKEKLKELKDIHKGQRCFIIGNGPSLTSNDLNRLKGEVTFAVNRIYLYYDKTEWRPQYYCVIDNKHLENSTDDIRKVKADKKFIPLCILHDQKKDIEDATYFDFDISEFYPQPPVFSEDISDRICNGMTVTYVLIQIAAYMGFKEIYLLGLDHSYTRELLPDGTIKINEGIVDYFQQDYSKKDDTPARIQHMNLAYTRARMFCQQNNIKIYNATRGGKLEVFERIDFDLLFK